jgi:hypothetical protein
VGEGSELGVKASVEIASLMIDRKLPETIWIRAFSNQRVAFLAESRLAQRNTPACATDLFSQLLQSAQRNERLINNYD